MQNSKEVKIVYHIDHGRTKSSDFEQDMHSSVSNSTACRNECLLLWRGKRF